jgi:predicted SAM-dependent methyltransferase
VGDDRLIPPVIKILKDWLRPYWHRWQRRRWRWPSETSKCRSRLAPFCTGYGIDVGCGGDPITPAAVRVDLPQPYAVYTEMPVQLGGDAGNLFWFRDGTLDFVYSSHVLEDFADPGAILREWLRVLKPGGRLVIFCPDEQRFRAHCRRTGQPYNTHHHHADFSLALVKAQLAKIGGTRLLYENPDVDIYSWDLVVEKIDADGRPTS